MRQGWPVAVVTTLALLAGASTAQATHNARDNVPAGLDSTVASAQFVIHYDPDTYTLAKAQLLRDDLEESHSKLVTGGGGTPNAGLLTPPDDGDGKTDVYIAAPTDWPDFTGGAVYGDPGHFSSYMFMTPGLSRTATRFRAAHEYMHNIQRAYYGGGTMLTES